MSSGRREFLERTAVIAAGLGITGLPLTAAQRSVAMPTPAARALMKTFGLKFPIFNSGMGLAATPELAIAVSNAGGLGALGTGGTPPPDVMKERVARTRAGTAGLFAVNYLLNWDPVSLPVVLEAGAPVIQFAWGQPSADAVAMIRRAGARMGIQISTAAGARQALNLGADYLICQGTEAGGHVQALSPLYHVLPAVLAEAKAVPVLVAGGVTTGAHIRRGLAAGAAGALMGTRFLATKECNAHDDYKNAVVRAKPEDTVMTICFQEGWPNAPHRVLRNKTLDMWEAAGCPPRGKRPGEGDVLTTSPITGTKRRYSSSMAKQDDQGLTAELPLYAGLGVDGVRDIPSAGDLVVRLWKECMEA